MKIIRVLTPLLSLICGDAISASGLFGDYIFVNDGSKGTLSMSNIKASGVSVESGGSLTLGNGKDGTTLNVLVNNDSSTGVLVSGKDSSLSVLSKNTYIESQSGNVTGILLNKNANLDINNVDIMLSGSNSKGIVSTEQSLVNLSNINISSIGSALSASDGGEIRINATSNKFSSYDAPVIQSVGNGSSVILAGQLELTGDLVAKNNGLIDIDLNEKSVFNGAVNGASGYVSVKLDDSVWNVSNKSTLQSIKLNNSLLSFSHRDGGRNEVFVNGDFDSNDSVLNINTVLGGDDSPTDSLVINGNSNGKAYVYVNNVGGSGHKTINGIKLIQVNGQSDAEFIQANRIVAGSYDYTLGRGNGDNSKNWYLTSDLVLRPEVGSYIANLSSANTLFQLRLQDRNGSAAYMTDDKISPQQKNMWIRHVGGQTRWYDSSSQLKTRSNRYTLQLGGDVGRWNQGVHGALRLGVMAGYGNANSHTWSSRTGFRSEGNLNGYSSGLYATWYANDETREGAYFDSWVLYNWFNNTVKGEQLQSESYRSKGVTASLEAGVTHKVKDLDDNHGSKSEWFVQPQIQVVMMDVHADNHQERNGTLVASDESTNVQTRVGVKTWLKKKHKLKNGQIGEISPFAEVNYINNKNNFGTIHDGIVAQQAGARNIGELKLGVEGQVNSHMNVQFNVSTQAGNDGYRDTAAMLGVQWRF